MTTPISVESHEQSQPSIAARVAPETLAAEGVREDFQQLRLADTHNADWELSEEARQTGLKGVAMARAALSNARPPAPRLKR